jgi:hypothetical protein
MELQNSEGSRLEGVLLDIFVVAYETTTQDLIQHNVKKIR